MNKKFLILLFGIFLISFVSAYTYSSQTNSFNYNYGTDVGFKHFDEKMCQAGQDFIIQVAPFGCEPTVVRSDLLEEQNVPVFCQLSATKINPLIDVQAINYISFQGNYPKEVSGIGFHPAQAAIKTSSSTLLNSPVLNNIGYAVIVLRQQKNESAMPKYVNGTLTANIKYDIKNAFGIGRATYYLPEIQDDEWGQQMNNYEFWNGKGFVRAEGIGKSSATISVYEDEFNKIASFNLEKGQTSEMTYMPGYYCMAGVEVRLDGLETPDTRVKLRINDEIVEVSEGEMFLDNKCRVTKIESKGIVSSVTINCNTDEGADKFSLQDVPKIKLKIGDTEKDYEIGEWLYDTEEGRPVYLGYLGAKGNSRALEDVFVYVVETPNKEKDRLTEEQLSSITKIVKDKEYKQNSGTALDIMNKLSRFIFGELREFTDYIFKSENHKRLAYSETLDFGGKKIQIIDFASAVDAQFSNDNLKSAMKDYQDIINKFSKETQSGDDKITFGEKALFEKIALADGTGQKKTMLDLCKEFKEKYPESTLKSEVDKKCKDEARASSSKISSRDISSDGIVKTISFEGIYEPTPDEYSAEIIIEGKMNTQITLTKNQKFFLKETGEFIQLIDLDEDSAEISFYVKPSSIEGSVKSAFAPSKKNLKEDEAESLEGDYLVTLSKVNLKKVAKVSVIPNIKYAGTEANFSFKIGIEKRAIQLTPEKISEKLVSINETITKWDAINTKLGNVVKGLKLACVGTGTYMTVKNFFNNMGGKATARQEVMSSDDGWYEICKSCLTGSSNCKLDKTYASVDACLLDKNDEIEADVNQVSGIMKNQEEITKDNVGERLIEIRSKLGDLEADVSEALTKAGYDANKVTLKQARDLERLQTIILDSSSSEELKAIALKEKNKILADIKANSQNYAATTTWAGQMNVNPGDISSLEIGKDAKKLPYLNKKYSDIKGKISIPSITDNPPIQLMQTFPDGKQYILVLDDSSGIKTMPIKKNIDGKTFLIYDSSGNLVDNPSKELTNIYFQKYDESSYQNQYKEPEVRFFETEPYKGYPAVVPIDVNKGWYAMTQQTVSGNLRAYDDSGRVARFYLCNVGENGKAEGIEEDDCTGFDIGTGQIYTPFNGLDDSRTKDLVEKAIRAIREAQNAYQQGKAKGGSSISILGQKVKVGAPAADVPGTQCQDFMSPKDCWTLFNVCDPVVCPSSRCNLGGAYPVKDVVQSGIVGSIALCLPNWNEKIYMPVCLTGVHAGIDSLLSVFKNYQDCLQYSLDTGEQVGVCDEIHSIYLCEFFWRQAGPITKLLIPKLIGKISGQGTRGGGEYLSVLDAYTKAGESVDYLVQYYGKNSYNSFNARSTEEVGTEVCKAFPSLVYGGNFIDKIIEPDSPNQYSAWFSEIPFTSATVPPISQYKVFYHIYAGKDRGAYYQVYLKSPTGSSFYYDNPMRIIATGYIPRGDYASETRDFTAPSGYQELCVNVNGQDECGFGKVSTDFAIDYMNDLYVKDQTMNTEIKTEKECVSGSVSLYGFTTSPNLEEGANKALNPSLASLGITRICSTANPGKATDANWENNNARWKNVGYCGNEKMKCWLDTNSVKAIIKSNYTENQILGEAAESNLEKLKSEGNYIDFTKEKEKIDALKTPSEKIIYITDTLIGRAFLNNEKAALLLIRGNAFGEIAKFGYSNWLKKVIPAESDVKLRKEKLKAIGIDVEGKTDEEINKLYEQNKNKLEAEAVAEPEIYPVFQFEDGKMKGNLFYTYAKTGWRWDDNKNDIKNGRGVSVDEDPEEHGVSGGFFENRNNKPFIISLRGKTYEEGLKLLIERTMKNKEKGWLDKPELSTESVSLSYKGLFTIEKTTGLGRYFEYNDAKHNWKWSPGTGPWSASEAGWFDVPEILDAHSSLDDEIKDLVKSLEGKDFYGGAEIIFAISSEEIATGIKDRRKVTYNFKSRTEKDVIQLMDEIKSKSVAGRTCSCGNDCASYAKFIVTASDKYNIPDPLLLLSIMMQESSCNKNAGSDSSIGLMQINVIECSGLTGRASYYGFSKNIDECKKELLSNPEKNILLGAAILGEKYTTYKNGKQFNDACKEENKKIVYYNWEAAVRGYNGWGCNPKFSEQDNFVEEVMTRWEELDSVSV